MRPRVAHLVRLALLAQLIVHTGIALVVAQSIQPSISTQVELNSAGLTELQRRLASLDAQDVPGRVRVLESDMSEVKWLIRGVAAAMIGQLSIAVMRRRQSPVGWRRDYDQEDA